MSTAASVVIGAGFGDEGKGLMVDALARGSSSLVVRFNGGAQAGHTVVTPDGRRHVFSHVGSGALTGAATGLSRFFICNPLLFRTEAERLKALGVAPLTVMVDPLAPVTTPWDMMINQAAETHRSGRRHGSCGLGIGETVERGLHRDLAITVADLRDRGRLRPILETIRTRWVGERLQALDVPAAALSPYWMSDAIMAAFLLDAEAFLDAVDVTAIAAAMARADHVILEGAQGLLLDQDHRFFPHVTRSKTGLHNAAILAAEAGMRRLAVSYMTRCYATRHGAGPFPGELPGQPHAGIRDDTNSPNDWQGSLRFGRLDLDLLGDSIADDLRTATGIDISARVVVTCLDQVGATTSVRLAGETVEMETTRLPDRVARHCGLTGAGSSWGPTRDGVRLRHHRRVDAV